MSKKPTLQERELKFAAVELAELRDRLLELQAERVAPPAFEDNWIFDRGKGEMSSKGHVLRLRIDGQGAQLTLKGAVRWEDKTKIRDELQTRVEDAEQMRAILEHMGYGIRRRYQKMREEWRLGAVLICLDHTPIGDFAEFEGQGADKLAKRCGLPPEKAEPRTYLELYEDHVKANPGAPPDMLFK
jgi:predicted adenylyl cyclase CyaB